jgi:site-specific recombinase XerD
LTEFADYWIENFADKWKVGPRKLMTKKSKAQYQKVSNDLKEFELSAEKKILLKEINAEVYDNIIVWLEDLNYQPSTISRFIKRIKFLCARAIQCGYSVSKNYNDKVFIEANESNIVVPVLNLDEIQSIYELDFSHDDEMDNIRDLFIIQLFSGIRISDMMNSLSTENVKNGFIELKTSKTGAWVSIPCHEYTKNILSKRFGQLPRKVAENEYNKQIKIICMLAKIDEVIYGKKFDADKNRKIAKYYPKYELITSHSTRRSLATMLQDKISQNALNSIMGWTKDSKMINTYNKKSTKDYAVELKNFWENEKQ